MNKRFGVNHMVRFTDEPYDASKCVRIVNPAQQYRYMKHGIYPIDIYPGYGDRNVFIFYKEDTQEVYEKWINHELE